MRNAIREVSCYDCFLAKVVRGTRGTQWRCEAGQLTYGVGRLGAVMETKTGEVGNALRKLRDCPKFESNAPARK